MTLWLRATKWIQGRTGPLVMQERVNSDELVAQSHKGWSG
jgi:hypothetical protein